MKQHVLSGVKIIDFSWVLAGPLTTKALGALGAEVIKIESTTRPEFAQRSGWFSVVNNNKASCTLNIKTEEAQRLIRELVAKSDVVVENFSAGVLDKYGLGYEDLRAIKPDIVFVSASGLGRSGPYRDYLAYGTLLQCFSGRVGLIGTPNAELESIGINPAWTDPVTAFWEILSILAALQHRHTTGRGSYVDLSMLESTVALLPESILRAGLKQAGAAVDASADASPWGCFRCAGEDSWLALSVEDDAHWTALCAVMGRPELVGRAEYADGYRRLRLRDELNGIVAAWLVGQDARETELLLQQAGVPAARSRGIKEVSEDPHVRWRGVFRDLSNGEQTITLPWMDEERWRGTFAPTPGLGADNDYVFGELLGLSLFERQELTERGVIA